jgi:SAM-dependent methyltransferase
MSKESGTSAYEFSEYLNLLSHRYRPDAKSALLLGLGCGLLAKQLDARGVKVTVAELEPLMEKAAREYFGMPDSVKVEVADARSYLNSCKERYDLVILDAFAGENAPWYLCTEEALGQVKRVLNPGGRMLANVVTRSKGSEGLGRLESGMLKAFGEAKVFVEAARSGEDTRGLVNASLVAGTALSPTALPFPSKVFSRVEPRLKELLEQERPAVAGGREMKDESSDYDVVEAELRAQWRDLVFQGLSPKILAD